MTNRNRNNELKLFLSDDEQKLLESKMKKAGYINKSQFIRQLIINGFVYSIDMSYLHEYSMQLQAIGTNINQIAARVNETRTIDNTQINKMKEAMDEIWQLQRSMQSKEPLINQ